MVRNTFGSESTTAWRLLRKLWQKPEQPKLNTIDPNWIYETGFDALKKFHTEFMQERDGDKAILKNFPPGTLTLVSGTGDSGRYEVRLAHHGNTYRLGVYCFKWAKKIAKHQESKRTHNIFLKRWMRNRAVINPERIMKNLRRSLNRS